MASFTNLFSNSFLSENYKSVFSIFNTSTYKSLMASVYSSTSKSSIGPTLPSN